MASESRLSGGPELGRAPKATLTRAFSPPGKADNVRAESPWESPAFGAGLRRRLKPLLNQCHTNQRSIYLASYAERRKDRHVPHGNPLRRLNAQSSARIAITTASTHQLSHSGIADTTRSTFTTLTCLETSRSTLSSSSSVTN